MEPKIEPAIEYYAFLFEDNGELDDIEDYIDCDERKIELAMGAAYIGELTDTQFRLLLRKYEKESRIRKFEYSVVFVDRVSIPPHKEIELKLLSNELTIDRQEMLNTLVNVAGMLRKGSGFKSKNIKSRRENSAESSLQPTAKPKSETKQTRNRTSKYETLVQTYLEQLKEGVLQGEIEQEKVTELTAMDVAKLLKDRFKATIACVEQRIRKTEAWKNKKKTFAPIYDTTTFRNRKNTNTPYQKVQECSEDS